MADPLCPLAARLSALVPAPGAARVLVGIAGPPGAGKSQLAGALTDRLGPGAAVVPMDGFHLDNRVLAARGLLPRKGAPETFDAEGFLHLLGRLRVESNVAIPVFDRARDIAIAGARIVGPETRIALVEGNYLLLDEAPWDRMAGLFDLTVFLDVGEANLTQRLTDRWLTHGLSRAEALARAEGNDLPNARRVARGSRPADICLAFG